MLMHINKIIGGVSAAVVTALMIASCADDEVGGANVSPAQGDSAAFELVCNPQTNQDRDQDRDQDRVPSGVPTPDATATPVANATPDATPSPNATDAGIVSQSVPIFFDQACTNTGTDGATGATGATGTTTAATPESTPSPNATPQGTPGLFNFAGNGIGPIRVTPDCDRRTVTFSLANADASDAIEPVTVPFGSDGSFVAQISSPAQLEQDQAGNANCATNVFGTVEGTVSCPGTTTGTTTNGANAVQVVMNAQWQFGAEGRTPAATPSPAATATPTASPSPVATATASPTATPTASPSPAATATATPAATPSPDATAGGADVATQCVFNNNECGFTTPVTLTCSQ